MARPSKPVDLILINGNKDHRTKSELKYRKEAEQSLYTGKNFTESKQVKEDKIAHIEFIRLKKLFASISVVDALDQQIINRYCLEISNQIKLSELLEKMEAKIDDCENLETGEMIQLYKSISGIISNIGKSKELLLKFEDRLFLNPATRIKSIPKKPEKKEPTRMGRFINREQAGGE